MLGAPTWAHAPGFEDRQGVAPATATLTNAASSYPSDFSISSSRRTLRDAGPCPPGVPHSAPEAACSCHPARLPRGGMGPSPRPLRTSVIATVRSSREPSARTCSITSGPSFPATRARSSASLRRIDGHGRSPARCRSPSAAPNASAACRESSSARASWAWAMSEKVKVWVLSSASSLASTDSCSNARASSR